MTIARASEVLRTTILYVAGALLCSAIYAAGATTLATQPDKIATGRLQVLEDETGHATIEQVREMRDRFSDVRARTPNYGYTPSAYWFRLSVENRRDQPVALFVDIPHPTLDHVTLHVFGANKRHTVVRTGDRIVARERPYAATTLVLPFELHANESAELYLRVRADAGAVIVPIELVEEEQLRASARTRQLLHGALLGLFGALFIYNLFIYLPLRERAYLYYVLHLPFALLTILALNGFGAAMLHPDSAWLNNEGLVFLSGITFFLILSFTREFLGTREHRDLDRWIKLLMVASVWLTIAPWLMPIRAAYQMDMLMVFVFPLVCAGVGIASWRRGKREAKLLVFGQVASWIGLVLFGLMIYDVLPFNVLLFEAISLGIAADALLLALALADRIRLLQSAKLEAENAARKNLEVRKEELERLVAERTGQLETARKKAELLATIDPLTAIFNRRGLLEAAEREVHLAVRRAQPLAVIMFDLDHFKRVNDKYGHAEGDRVLCAVAASTRGVIRNTDLFGRIGGEEFLLVLPDSTREVGAEIAERVRASIENEVLVGDPPEPITASFGIALLSTHAESIDTLESLADAALYRAKRNGRNRVECADQPAITDDVSHLAQSFRA